MKAWRSGIVAARGSAQSLAGQHGFAERVEVDDRRAADDETSEDAQGVEQDRRIRSVLHDPVDECVSGKEGRDSEQGEDDDPHRRVAREAHHADDQRDRRKGRRERCEK